MKYIAYYAKHDASQPLRLRIECSPQEIDVLQKQILNLNFVSPMSTRRELDYKRGGSPVIEGYFVSIPEVTREKHQALLASGFADLPSFEALVDDANYKLDTRKAKIAHMRLSMFQAVSALEQALAQRDVDLGSSASPDVKKLSSSF